MCTAHVLLAPNFCLEHFTTNFTFEFLTFIFVVIRSMCFQGNPCRNFLLTNITIKRSCFCVLVSHMHLKTFLILQKLITNITFNFWCWIRLMCGLTMIFVVFRIFENFCTNITNARIHVQMNLFHVSFEKIFLDEGTSTLIANKLPSKEISWKKIN
uniref:CSON011847 protein n=1 Tax=Culicoides sonorensis TaxID=179676 RepID=A0A336M6N4_CULSO